MSSTTAHSNIVDICSRDVIAHLKQILDDPNATVREGEDWLFEIGLDLPWTDDAHKAAVLAVKEHPDYERICARWQQTFSEPLVIE